MATHWFYSGDNSVLMNKVAKEQLGLFKPRNIKPAEFNLSDRGYLHNVLERHEQRCFTELGKGKGFFVL